MDVVGGEWVRWFLDLTCDFWAKNEERKISANVTTVESIASAASFVSAGLPTPLVRKVREIGAVRAVSGSFDSPSASSGSAQDDGGVRFGGNALSDRTGEEDQISIGIYDDEGCGAPGFLLEGLVEGDFLGLICVKELFDLVCGGDGDRSRCSRSRILPANTGSSMWRKERCALSRVTCA